MTVADALAGDHVGDVQAREGQAGSRLFES
jgi:hypothetical protein